MGISRQCLLAGGLLLFAGHLLADLSLGPVDGAGLAPKDLDRVTLGEPAPDFRLSSHTGDVRQLSEYREAGEVVLVFYRGYW